VYVVAGLVRGGWTGAWRFSVPKIIWNPTSAEPWKAYLTCDETKTFRYQTTYTMCYQSQYRKVCMTAVVVHGGASKCLKDCVKLEYLKEYIRVSKGTPLSCFISHKSDNPNFYSNSSNNC
jgi:hypothetical protein